MGASGLPRQVEIQSARTGRPRSSARQLSESDRVVVTARLPAGLAAKVYEQARVSHEPVSAVVAGILAAALDGPEVSTS